MQPVAPTTTTTVTTVMQPIESKEAKVVSIDKERVLVKGFLVVHNLPSKSLLTTRLSEIFKETKIGQKIIKIVTGYFYNRLGVLSRDYYEILHKYAVDVGFGYIVPMDVAPSFLREVDFIRRRYEIYEQWLKEFLLTGKVPPELAENKRAVIDYEYVQLVKEYLQQYGISEEDWKKIVDSIHVADRFYVRLIPFSIDYALLQEYVDEKAKQRVEQEIEKLKEEIAKGIKEKILAEAKKLIARIEQLAKTEITKEMLPRLRSEIEELEKRAAEFGVNVPELEKLKEMLTEEKLKEIALEASSGRLRALLNF
jgi:phosphoglycolate phosphatase-like HAD superfamily hydrolase